MKLNVQDIIKSAGKHNLCDKLDGITTWAELCKILLTAQGREFCEKNKFPSLEQFRSIDYELSQFGVYVDAGVITLENCKDVALVGNTVAKINISINTRVTKIMVMHGAKAIVNASNYAVILPVNIDGEVEVNKDETSVILQ